MRNGNAVRRRSRNRKIIPAPLTAAGKRSRENGIFRFAGTLFCKKIRGQNATAGTLCLRMAIKIGMRAPSVTLKMKTEHGIESVALTRSVGKKQTVLLFVPLAFTGACSDELCTISKTLHAYAALDADVIAVSVDSPFAQEAWKKSAGFSLTLLSDFNRAAVTAYDVSDENFLPEILGFHGVAKRSAFIIGKDGIIKFAWSSNDPAVMPPFDEIRQKLAEA